MGVVEGLVTGRDGNVRGAHVKRGNKRGNRFTFPGQCKGSIP